MTANEEPGEQLSGARRILATAIDALSATVRYPNTTARLAAYLERFDGAAIGFTLRHHLSHRERRRAAAGLLSTERDVVVSCDGGGFRWTLPVGDEIFAAIVADGEYQGDRIRALLAWLEQNAPAVHARPVVLDIGANVGTTSLPFARAGYRVLAVEPVPATFAFLRENVERNGFGERITCVQCALDAARGTAAMAAARRHGTSELVTDAGVPERAEHIEVATAPLDGLLADHGIAAADVAFVWCDVQGHERTVVETGETVWKSGTPFYAEIWPEGLDRHGGTDTFAAAAARHFDRFVAGPDLVRDGVRAATRPIAELRDFVEACRAIAYDDALFLRADALRAAPAE